jgi:alkanesulfonate monooxygenase SsuD/methylene tetrahydromethanopterin reductase-like flavin-dependent oxidoreductase (luciferase family)
VEVVLSAWTSEKLSHQGEFFHFDGVEVLPKPRQAPHPPVWMAATSEGAIDWAAGRGFSILMDPHCTRTELGDKRRRYGEQLAAAGHADGGRDIPMARLIAVATDAERALAVARRGAQWTVGSYIGTRPGDADPVERYVNEVIVHGEPQSVIDQVLSLKESAQLNYLLCAPLSQESFELLTDKVLPALV